MINGTLAIFDSDIDYLHRLSEYLRVREDFPYDIIIFDNMDSLCEYSQKPIDILITSIIPDDLPDTVKGDVFYLCTEPMTSYKHYPCIYKYQSADTILRSLMERCQRTTLNKDNSKSYIIGVYSPINRCGKTSFSVCLSYGLSEISSTLLLSFDSFSFFNDLSDISSQRDLSDLLLYYRDEPFNLRNKILTLTSKFYELNLLCPPLSPRRISDIDVNSWTELIEQIASLGLYKYIVLDLSELPILNENIFMLCNKVYMPYLCDYPSQIRQNAFFEYLGCIASYKKEDFLLISLPDIGSCADKTTFINELTTGKMMSFARNIIPDITGVLEKRDK